MLKSEVVKQYGGGKTYPGHRVHYLSNASAPVMLSRLKLAPQSMLSWWQQSEIEIPSALGPEEAIDFHSTVQ